MWYKSFVCILLLIANEIIYINGCTIPDINWNIPIANFDITDTDRGEFHRYSTSGIIDIISSEHGGDELVKGPYITAELDGQELVLALHSNFENFEEYETVSSMGFTIIFSCEGIPNRRDLVLNIQIRDTNNNPPIFIPTNEISFSVIPPLAPGFKITGCNDHVVVRDIDLTTTSIDFGIEDNEYFEIYLDTDSTVPNSKNFLAVIRTKTFIRSIPEPIQLIISATDVDRTNDPPHTTNATLTIERNLEFQLPDDLIFTEIFYLASYTTDHTVELMNVISLEQGFDEKVSFEIFGDLFDHFTLTGPSNSLTLSVQTPLSPNVLREKTRVLLIVTAERELVSSTSATIVIDLPRADSLQFENFHYEGKVIDNVLTIEDLIILQEDNEGFNINIISEYSSYFSYDIIQENILRLSMLPLSDDVLLSNNYISLQIVANSGSDSTTCLVTLDIIKDDLSTPVFESTFYTETYDIERGFIIEDITLIQGFDDTVLFEIDGDDGDFFQISPSGNRIRLTGTIPNDILQSREQLIFSVLALKPRTVDGTTTIIINLPPAVGIEFEYNLYEGIIKDNVLEPLDLNLVDGFQNGFEISIISDYASNFDYNIIDGNVISLNMSPLDNNVIQRNNFISLEVIATSTTSKAIAIVTLNIIKDDFTTPLFEEHIYKGNYDTESGLQLNEIVLIQGYDEFVNFDLLGDHARYFRLNNNNNRITILANIPSDIVLTEEHLIFSITATKPRAIETSSTVFIQLPSESKTNLKFSNTYYTGSLKEGNLTMQDIILEEGFGEGTIFSISGELQQYFILSNKGNVVTLNLNPDYEIPVELINDLDFTLLEIAAERPQSISGNSVIVIDIISNDDNILKPVFRQPYYNGYYTFRDGLTFNHIIDLEHDYDHNVLFILEGEDSEWFTINSDENKASIKTIPGGIPMDVLIDRHNFIFSVLAETAGLTGRAAIIIALTDANDSELTILQFGQTSYRGVINNNNINLEHIELSQGYSENISFDISGEQVSYFQLITSNSPTLTLELNSILPESEDRLVILQLRCYGPNAITAYATIILETQSETDVPLLVFSEVYYSGTYSQQDGLDFNDVITLTEGYNENVIFAFEGIHSQWFVATADGNRVNLATISTGIPMEILANNQHLTLTVRAERPGAITGRSAIVIALLDEFSDAEILRFEQTSYRGTIEDNIIILDQIKLVAGFSEDINFDISGEHATFFRLVTTNAPILTLELNNDLPANIDRLLILQLQSYGPNAVTAYATIILETQSETDVPLLVFSEVYYSGSYNQQDGLDFNDVITLTEGYNENVIFAFEGIHSQWFVATADGNRVNLATISTGIPMEILANNQHLTLTVRAERPGAITGRSAIVIALLDEFSDAEILRFEQTSYRGTIEDNIIILDQIKLVAGFSEDINFDISGEHATFFRLVTTNAPILTLELNNDLPANIDRLLILQLQSYGPNAVTAYATIILETQSETDVPLLVFSEVYYSGSYNQQDGLDFNDVITLTKGYNENVIFELEGIHSQWFVATTDGNKVNLATISTGIPMEILANNQHLTLTIRAERPGAITGRSAIVIALTDGSSSDIYFLRALYFGSIELEVFQHESIELVGYDGDVQIIGDWSDLFTSRVSNGEVHIEVADGSSIPLELNHVTLELRADVARTVLSIEIFHRDESIPPAIEFDPTFYIFRVDVTITGFIGRVNAVSNNGESIIYSLQINNEHLASRLSINDQGELHLSAPVTSGQYRFLVVATTAASGVSETAPAELIIDAITVCGDDYVIPPLIIIERDEEEAHENLVVLEDDVANHCHLSIVNHWPPNQYWLTVDERGLHAAIIDREDESIAFMTVSQIRVELILHCDNDETTRTKRSIVLNNTYSNITNSDSRYDYGSNKWVLTDTILYNSRRSFVNLIVNDINDNNPIFEGKDTEPIIVGYPIPDLIEVVMPRSLAEVKATDKDIDINAQLVYWSDEPALTVDREAGIVHVRNNMLELVTDESEYIISVRDRPGMDDWRFGTITLRVKLLNKENIAVLIIRDVFSSDEQNILKDISNKLQYDVKSLRTSVISAEYIENNKFNYNKNKRESQEQANSGGASLLLYVYGLENSIPVTASRIINDLHNIDINTITIISNIVLEDYIDSLCPAPGRDTALFAATISLSVILFVLIIFVVLWYIFKIRKIHIKYNEFSGRDSISNQSHTTIDILKVDVRPKMNIEHIKKSERRLQEMLNASIDDNTKEPTAPQSSQFVHTDILLDINTPDKNAPIVIQSIDKLKDANDQSEEEDEFGEIKTSLKRRKSVVTFNENVEKIIHVEDHPDDAESVPDYEVDRL